MYKDSFSAEQMAAVLDNAPTAIYVSAVDNCELLYYNRLAEKLFVKRPGDAGITCYGAAGFDKPCPFCRIREISADALFVREFQSPVDGRMYQLSGKLIEWNGRTAHIEYVLDITVQKQQEDQNKALKERLQATFSNIPCGLCVYQYDGVHIVPLFHNPAFYSIMGYSDEHIAQLERETSFLGVHPADIGGLMEKIQAAIQRGGLAQHTYRLFNDRAGEYRWIHLDGSVKPQPDGAKLLYGVYSDVSEQVRLEKELADANEKMQDIINAIPGGVAIYKVSDIFKTVYFSDGVPALTGHTAAEYRELIKRDATEMTYAGDTAMVLSKVREVIQTRQVAEFEFRKQHKKGYIVWVRVQVKWIGEEDGCPLLNCVFHNISALKEAQLELRHLVNSIPGGIASYRVMGNRFVPDFFSDGVSALTGHSREEYAELVARNAVDTVYEQDRVRVDAAAKAALASGEVLDVSFRMRHKNGSLVWLHLNGRRMGPLAEVSRFYAVFTGMSEEARLFQSIANETIDGVYVVGKENYDLLYANESRALFMHGGSGAGQKCFRALHGLDAPCSGCILKSGESGSAEQEVALGQDGRFYSVRFRETDWNGIPAYIKFVRDVTEEVKIRREKERLERYFQTVVKNLPGGVAVVRYEQDGALVPEYMSDGFAELTGMPLQEAWRLYQGDAMRGVHPDDRNQVDREMERYMASGDSHCEIIYRLEKGDGSYVWVKNTLSMIQDAGGEKRVYAVYHDMTKEREEQELLRQQYNEIILQHYRTPGPNELVLGHCNITRNKIIEIIDYTGSDLLSTFGSVREEFFSGIAGLVVDAQERQAFLNTYLNGPALAAFERNETEQILDCFIKLPKDQYGRYVRFKVNMVSVPDTGDITGILTVTDRTEQTLSDRILHQLSVTNYDFIVDLDLEQDLFTILKRGKAACPIPPQGSHTQWTASMLQHTIVPKDRGQYAKSLEPAEIRRRLQEDGPYTFAYSIMDGNGDIRTKNMTVSAVDLRLGRVCLVRTDITDSVREQQGLLNVIAYTFELMGLVDIQSSRLTMYTRETVLKNLSPYIIEDFDAAIGRFAGRFDNSGEVRKQFKLETVLARLAEKQAGYDFVFPYQTEEGIRYKQVNVLWGDENHKTVCLVRADVTDMLAAEREAKSALEKALLLAEEASRAKSDFLSAMSHDIRTPMNGIMGMTALANAHLDNRERVADCLQKISISSKHLLSLINDVLDMSKIERVQINLNRIKLSLPELTAQIGAIIESQARAAGLRFLARSEGVVHPWFYGDGLRISQILINLLSNAVKFTPQGGCVDFLVEELAPPNNQMVRYRFTVRDTGIGMSEDFLAHLFEPFARSYSAVQIEGTGLGLSITKGLVDLMGGSISVKSQVGKGSVFQVLLEFEAAEAREDADSPQDGTEAAAEEEEDVFAGRSFLVAEDNAINAEILCELLQLYGARLVVKTDGAQAVEAFRTAPQGSYDVVLMDIQMPVMNGYEATRAIRGMERQDAKTIPIIAMTANAFAEDVQAAKEAGMTAHVAKPIDLDVLRAALRKALNRKS